MAIHHPGVTSVSIISLEEGSTSEEIDEVAVEEPMEIELGFASQGKQINRAVAVTMRTPGHDVELAVGFLWTEGILRQPSDLNVVETTGANGVRVVLKTDTEFDMSRLDRQSFVSSSCGVCGKRAISAVFATQHVRLAPGVPQVAADIIHHLPQVQRESQANFHRTGGIHASALFDQSGNLIAAYEDVGRHNALDKLIGAELLAGHLPLSSRMLLLSGRASFELIQKAVLAGIPVVASVGAPSSLAIQLARDSGMTLLGFVRENRFNVYSDAHRLQLPGWHVAQGTTPAEVNHTPLFKG